MKNVLRKYKASISHFVCLSFLSLVRIVLHAAMCSSAGNILSRRCCPVSIELVQNFMSCKFIVAAGHSCIYLASGFCIKKLII